jgi:hypothetical protein
MLTLVILILDNVSTLSLVLEYLYTGWILKARSSGTLTIIVAGKCIVGEKNAESWKHFSLMRIDFMSRSDTTGVN